MDTVRLRDRIVALRRIKARDLQGHAHNWRTHPQFQQDALAAVIRDVGIASALLVYDSARQGGLTVIDGHLRKETHPDFEWPCLMLDVNDAEADEILATHDPLAALAIGDTERLSGLLHQVQSGEAAVQALLSQVAESHGVTPPAFAPVGADKQGRLDETKPITCPHCGEEFRL